MSQTTHEHSAQEASLSLYKKNKERIKNLDPAFQDFYQDCQSYLYLSTPPSLAVDQTLSQLIDKLELAQKQGISIDAMIGLDGESYCKQVLRRLKAPKYSFEVTPYMKYIFYYVLLTMTIVAIFEGIRGGFYYGDLAAAFQMPVAISLLGLPLQVLTILTAFFFGVQFRLNRSFDATWYSNSNPLYLMAFLISLLAAITIPFITHYYGVFLVRFPVWLVLLVALITAISQYLSDKISLSDHFFNFVDARQANDQATNHEGQNYEAITSDDYYGSEEEEFDVDKANDNNLTLWQTVRLKNPLITRKSYRKMRQQEDKADKEHKNHSNEH